MNDKVNKNLRDKKIYFYGLIGNSINSTFSWVLSVLSVVITIYNFRLQFHGQVKIYKYPSESWLKVLNIPTKIFKLLKFYRHRQQQQHIDQNM